ncbi:MAG: DUF1189 domain-containing protein [Acetivibrionales bacterium]|jgi:hypothetical protein
MNETKLGFFSRFYYSITSFEKYRLFLRQSTSKAVVYLLLLSLILSLAVYLPGIINYNNIIDNLIANFNTTVPDFRLANGRLEVDGKMPIILNKETYAIIIDTSPNADERILDEYDTAMLITSDKVIQKNFADKATVDLDMLQGVVMTKASIKQALPVMKPLGIIVFIFIMLYFICSRFVRALFISVIGIIINAAKRTGLSYRSIFKLSVYSMTLPLLLFTILNLVPVIIPFRWFLFNIIAAIYLYNAIGNIRKEIDKTMGTGSL